MFAKSADVSDLKEMVKSLSRSVEDLTTEVHLLRQEMDKLKS